MKALYAKQLLDVSNGSLIPNPIVIIRDDRVVDILTKGSKIPNGLEIIDASNLTILPGLIDSHTHITYHYDPNGRFGFSNETDLNKIKENAIATLNAGFTTIRDVGAKNGLDIELRNMINNGKILGPRILVSGEPIFSIENDLTQAVMKRAQQGVDLIKVFNDMRSPNEANLTESQIRQIVNTADRFNLPVSIHSFYPISTIESSNGGASSLEHGSFMSEQVADILAKNKTALIPTLQMPLHYLNNQNRFNFSSDNWDHFKRVASNEFSSVGLGKSKGIPIVFGTDAVAGVHGHNAKEFLLLHKAGLTPLEAIQSATINPPKILRRYDIGQIKPGYKADIIGVIGNPLEDLRYLLPENIKLVIKDGKRVK